MQSASPALQRAYGRQLMNLTLTPDIGQIIVRSKSRLVRLNQAIKKEQGKPNAGGERLATLISERDLRKDELRLFLEG